MNTFGRSITIILACILLFLFPIQYDAELMGTIADTVTENGVYELTEKIRNSGSLKKTDYAMFMNAFGTVDESFHLEIEVAEVYSNGEQEYMLTGFYDDLDHYFETKDELIFAKGEYITVYLIKDQKSDLVRLQELFFHKAVRKQQIVYGGRIT